MPDPAQIAELLAFAHIEPISFEAELGMLIHKWMIIIGIDNVVEGIDAATNALETNRDLQMAAVTGPTPSRT